MELSKGVCIVAVCLFLIGCSYGRPRAQEGVGNVLDFGTVPEKPSDQPAQDAPHTKESNEEGDKDAHDEMSRKLSEKLKQVPIKAGDAEEIMHGGHHVHGDDHGDQKPIGVGGDGLVEMMDGKPKEEEKVAPSTLDTEELMHTGEGGHGHNPHQGNDDHSNSKPSADNPEDLLHIRDTELLHERLEKKAPGADNPEDASHAREHHESDKKQHHENGEKVGVDVEEVVHGEGHAHEGGAVMEEYVDKDGVTKKRKLGREITMKDIEDLGLSKEELKGIDLGRLLRRDKSEYNAWKKEKENEDHDKGFWEKVDDFRSNYFNMLSNSIRHLSQSDDDDDDNEWEIDNMDNEPHPGENRVEHESEMWGSTNNKKKRRRTSFTVLHRPTHDGNPEL